MSEEMKKVNTKVELNDDELDLVAGGVIPIEEWNKMTPEERIAAKRESVAKRKAGEYCILD